RRDGVKRFVATLDRRECDGTIGAVVANCNPFTKGHRYLMETAASRCCLLHVFVLSAEKSLFPAEMRMKMVQRGTAHLDNVLVQPSGD
ncbi:MAG: adenylyltransferase/cytidyltransferase family protein, partial [Pyramidobacter sp.]|nr:adenylyltransferase/cytidyltransferase family protein [Pyramidobacter sp.]